MTSESRGNSVRGIIPPMATPLASIDELDVPGLEKLTEHILQGGAHALFLLGTTGEGPALSYKVRQELVQRTCRQVAGRVPVLVGITDSAFPEMLRMADSAAEFGADAVVVAPPFYFQLGQPDLLRLIEGLADHSALPIYLYNQPELTKINFSPDTVSRAAEIPKVAGIKDSSGDMSYLKELLARRSSRPDFKIFVGPEHLLEEALECGADGGVPGGANIFPDLPVQLYRAHERGDRAQVHAIQERINMIGSPIWNTGEAGPGYLRRLKCALNVLGLCSPRPAWPYIESAPEERAQIEQHLTQCGLKPVSF